MIIMKKYMVIIYIVLFITGIQFTEDVFVVMEDKKWGDYKRWCDFKHDKIENETHVRIILYPSNCHV